MRFFRYGELPLVLLALLDQTPATGYELMTELDRLFSPDYNPSPGSVYPALSALVAEGLVRPVPNASPKRYRVTTTGSQALRARLDELAWIERRTGKFLRPEGSVEAELDRLIGVVRGAAGVSDPNQISRILKQTHKKVTALLAEKGREE